PRPAAAAGARPSGPPRPAGRLAPGGGPVPTISGRHAAPCAAPALAYRVRNETVFQYVSSTLRTISSSVSAPIRRVDQGEPEAAKNHRTASAPCASISGIGSITLPRCLLILRPCSSTTRPRHTTFS